MPVYNIELKNCSITNSQVPDNFRLDYKRELLTSLEIFPEGVSALEMNDALQIIQKLNKLNSGDTLSITDDEHKYLTARINKMKYTIVAPEYVAFRNDIIYAIKSE